MRMDAALLKEAQALQGETLRRFRHLHSHPEVTNQEINTNVFIREELTRLGVFFHAPSPTITIAEITGSAPGATIGLRCDTDALPVQEETGLAYASQSPGKMHACGHDGHTAMGLGAAELLQRRAGEMAGRVKIIFQPAEEMGGGADRVLETGLVDDVDVFFAIHLWSPYASSCCHVSPCVVTAAVDSFTIQVRGKGGHGATPENCKDPLLAAAQLVVAAQAIVSRMVTPTEAAVVTIGSFHGGMAGNIIPENAELKGTVRSTSQEMRGRIQAALRDMVRHIPAAYGCQGEITFMAGGHSEVRNHPAAAALARECALLLTDEAHVKPQRTFMLGDDFSCYNAKPLCYVQLGIADEKKGTTAAHHNGKFKVDEDVLPLGAAWMTLFSLRATREWQTPTEGGATDK